MVESITKKLQVIKDQWRELKGSDVLVMHPSLATPKLVRVIDVSEEGKVLLFFYPVTDWEDVSLYNIVAPVVEDPMLYYNSSRPEVIKTAPDEEPGLARDKEGTPY